MAKHDLTYKLANKSLKGFLDPLRYLETDNHLDVVREYFVSIDNKDHICSGILEKFKKSVKSLSFNKSIKGLVLSEVREKYPNLIGEMFSHYNNKSSRQCYGQFFTPKQVTGSILDYFDLDLSEIHTVIDPCCGVGGLLFDDRFKDKNIVYNDLSNVTPFLRLNSFYNGFNNIKQMKFDCSNSGMFSNNNSDGVLMMLNPPFIKDSAIEFCNIANEYSEYLILIVPSNFFESKTYKQASKIILENFDQQNKMSLSGDTFDWFETKISTTAFFFKKK